MGIQQRTIHYSLLSNQSWYTLLYVTISRCTGTVPCSTHTILEQVDGAEDEFLVADLPDAHLRQVERVHDPNRLPVIPCTNTGAY